MAGASSPYKTNQARPQMKLSVVVFLDILGFSTRVMNECLVGNGDRLLRNLARTLKRAKKHLREDWGLPSLRRVFWKFPRLYEVKAFTDNIVIGFPFQGDGESEMGSTWERIAHYQCEMTLGGFFVRGGMAVAPHYMDRDLVFGPGLIESHHLEENVAVYPRVILSDDVARFVVVQMDYYGLLSDAPHNHFLAVDGNDGHVFVNYLSACLEEDDYGDVTINRRMLDNHAKWVGQNLADFAKDPHILIKYQWAARYHDWFCKRYRLDLSFPHIHSTLQEPLELSVAYPALVTRLS